MASLPCDAGEEAIRVSPNDIFPGLIQQQDTNGEGEGDKNVLDWYSLKGGSVHYQHRLGKEVGLTLVKNVFWKNGT